MPRTKEAFEAMREAARTKIETSALSLFARKGLSVTMEEIARAAGLSKGLIYNHYPSKEALIAELVRQATEISSQSINMLAQSPASAVEKIKQITSIMCEMLRTSRVGIENFMFMIQVGMSGFYTQEILLYSDSMPNPTESLAKIVAQGQSEDTIINGDPLQLSTVYWAAIQGFCCFAITGMPFSPNPRDLNRILLKGDYYE